MLADLTAVPSLGLLGVWITAVLAACPNDPGAVFGTTNSEDFEKIYDPSIGESVQWYINDHTFVKGADGTWHLFGITHEEPADPVHEHVFAHATAPQLHGPWTKQAMALEQDDSYGETQLWAPYVLESEGTYYMYYCGGGPDPTNWEINLATSNDLFNWTRRPEGPVFRDGFAARDPFVARIGNQWVIYYCGNTDPVNGGHHAVVYRTSSDLVNWGDRKIAFTDPTMGTGAGVTESPYVYQHGEKWYLFLGPRPSQEAYTGTDVFISSDPFSFDVNDRVGHIKSHALEVIEDGGVEYVSHAGWGQGGVHLAPLHWDDSKKCPVVADPSAACTPNGDCQTTWKGYNCACSGARNTFMSEMAERGINCWEGEGNGVGCDNDCNTCDESVCNNIYTGGEC